MNLVEEAVRNWGNHRMGVITELENIPEEHWDYQPGPGARTLRELAQHIAEAGVFFTTELFRRDCSFSRLFDPQVRGELRTTAVTKTEVIDLLRSNGETGVGRLREIGDALVTQTMRTAGGQQSRLSGLWFAIAHESYHRGQLASYTRGVGREPAMTQQIKAMAARSPDRKDAR